MQNATKTRTVKAMSDAERAKEEIIDAFFSKKAEQAKIFLERNPIPAELLKKNTKQ